MPSTGTTSPARTDEHGLTGLDLVDRHLEQLTVTTNERRTRCPLDKGRQLTPSAPVRRLLERIPAGEHQRHYRPGEVLAESQRAGHREERNCVDADIAVQQ
jgi:hypothetical protein